MKDIYSREDGVESGSGSDCSNAKKKLRKMDFVKPMDNLARSLETLYNALENADYALSRKPIQQDVMGKYTNIVALASFASRPNYSHREANDEEGGEVDHK